MASEKPFVSAGRARAAQGPVHYFPVFLVPLLLGPVRGDHALSKAESPPPSAPMAGTQASDSLRGGGHGFSCLFNMGGLVGQERKLQMGTGSSGTGLLQFMRQWEVGPWRVRGPLCQLHVGWPWRIASPLSSLGGTGGNRTRSVMVLVPASWCDTVLWLRKVSPWGMDSLFVSLPVS